MNNKKKEEERFYLNKFLALMDISPLHIEDGESPDFLVKLKESQIGVEVTKYHSGIKGEKGRPRRAIEEDWAYLQKKIMAEVKQHKELENTNGLIFFKRLELPSRSEHTKFINELVQFALEMIQNNIIEAEPKANYQLLMNYVKNMFIKNSGCYITWDWNHNVSSIGLSEAELIDAIKAKLVANYSESKFDELWLLIYSGDRLSQAMGIHLLYELNNYRSLEEMLRKSCFNKIFIFRYMFDSIYKWPEWIKIKGEDDVI
jgi:hypothetical protein